MKRAVAALGICIALVVPALSIGTHVRPVAATPVLASLVPAYEQCVAPDRVHGPPLVHGSCASPQQVSDYLTVGTFDANGQAAKSVGSFRSEGHPGVPGPPTDNQISLKVSITDVRCKGISTGCPGPGADYTGTVQARLPMQITDHWNATAPGGGNNPATVQKFNFEFPVTCTATQDGDVGSTCARSIRYIEEIIFGQIQDGIRSLWEYGSLEVMDGGADGDGTTGADNTLFAVQGLFVP